jgi:filamentous hemagglutinin family protein
MNNIKLPKVRLLAFILAVTFNPESVVLAAGPAPGALPTGGQITAGSGAINQAGNVMNIQQNTARMITNWQTFNVGQNAKVNFLQPSASAVSLNRVLSADPSQILGQLNANGVVVLLNPNGVLFGASARVDVGGLISAAMHMSDADFLAGKYQFGQPAIPGKVENLGALISREGGFVTLVGGTVNNAGQILTPGGTSALVAGDKVTVNLGLTGLVSVDVEGGSTAARVDNSGLIAADGGKVLLTAKSAAPMLASAVNQSGSVRANSIGSRNGEIWIEATGGDARLAGTTQAAGLAAGEKGGRIVVTGDQVSLAAGSTVDASGTAGGGQALIGGGWQGKDARIATAGRVTQEAGATIKVNATSDGEGGTAVLWSGQATRMDGTISAQGAGSGAGGQVETSSQGSLGLTGQVDLSAPSGQGGNWLLDPTTLTVTTTTNINGTNDTVANSSVQTALNASGATVTLQADSLITVNADISKTAGTASTLTFNTPGSIVVNNQISSITGALNINMGADASQSGGTVTLNNALATNGGDINFYKPTTLANTTPISTKITEASSSKSGNVTFYGDLTLAAPGYAVTINAQGPQSGASFTGRGGNIDVRGNIVSGTYLQQYPQALTLDTTGADATPSAGPGTITLGSSSANTIGGNGTAGLKSLSLVGPMTTQLNAGTINIFSTSGDVITASSLLGTPSITLDATSTTINVSGGTYGSNTGFSDYLQSTFDIVKAAGDKTLTINADRTIKLAQRSIDGTTTSGKLDVALNPFRSTASGNTGGAAILQGSDSVAAAIRSNGGTIAIGTSGTAATGFGADISGIKDGIYLDNAVLDSRIAGDAGQTGANITLNGRAPTTTVAGAGVRIKGALANVRSGTGNLSISGTVPGGSSSGQKDGVVIGEDGSSRVTLATTSGAIAITGDATSVGTSPSVTGASRYDGVVVSSAALIQSGSGAITVVGKGSGGDQSYLVENHGIKLENAKTSIVSTSGAISLYGSSGGKTSDTGGANSFGIYSAGDTMYIGSAPISAVSGGVTASGNIVLAADSMQLINSSNLHLNVASSGELRIHTETAARDIAFGTTGGVDKLNLGSTWFNGATTSIFQPGFTDVVFGHAASATSALAAPVVSSSTGTLTVGAATTLRDHAIFEMDGTGGAVKINSALTVKGSSGDTARSLTLNTDAGATGAGTIEVHSVQLLGSGDNVLTGANLVGKLAANIDGNLAFNNSQALAIDSVNAQDKTTAGANTWFGSTKPTTNGITTNSHDATLALTAGDLTINQSITAGTATVSLSTPAGKLTEAGGVASAAPNISAGQLYVGARDSSLLNNDNVVGTLAASITAGNLEFRNTTGLDIGQVAVTARSAQADGSVTTAVSNRNGLTATNAGSGKVALQLTSGNLTQSQDIAVTGLQLDLTSGFATLGRSTNDIGTLSAVLHGAAQTLTLNDRNNLTVGTLTSALLGSTSGVTTSNGNVTISASADAASTSGNLTLDQFINAGTAVVDLASGKGAINENATVSAAIITASQLRLTAVGTSLLNNANQVDTLAGAISGDAQGLDFRNARGLTVGSVAGTDGLTIGGAGSRGTLLLDTTAAPTGTGTLDQTQPIKAAGLLLRTNGDVTLTNPANAVASLAADTAGSNLNYVDADNLTIGTLAPNVGGSSTAGISAGTTSGGKTVKLESLAGALSQSAASPITTENLYLGAQTGVVLDNTGNDVAVIAGRVSGTGAFVFADKNILTVGTVANVAGTPVDGVQTTNGDIRLSASKDGASSTGDLALTQDVIAGGDATMTLEALKGAVSETGNVDLTATRLLVNAQDTTSLDNTGGSGKHLIGTLAASITGSPANFGFRNDQALIVGSVTAQDSITPTLGVTTANGNIRIATLGSLAGDAITIVNNIGAGTNGSVDIRAGGTAGDIAIDGASVRSTNGGAAGSGTVQLVAGRNISTSTANGTTTEIGTAGSVLLQAAGTIGADGRRIELQDVATLASQAGGDTWLRKLDGTSNDLLIGAVTALNPSATFGGTVADLAGVMTTANNGRIALSNDNGAITVVNDVTANGSGSIDLRTGGTNKAIALNGATLSSTSGQVQVLASGDISTSTANGTTTEIATSGNALLVAGGAIGADGRRIETSGVNTLAAESVGAQWLRQTSGDLIVGAVTALKPNDVGGTDKAGLVTTAGNAPINLDVTAGSLTVISNISANGSGSIDLRTGGTNKAIALNGATLSSTSGQVQVLASGDISTSTANGTTTEIATSGNALLVAGGAIGADGQRIETSGVNTLAAESTGAQWLRQTSGDLIVGAVTALKPNDVGGTDKAGLVTTAGNAPINLDVTAGSLTVISNISANGSGSIDLRTGGTNKAIALNGATLSSTSGQVQVLASGDISTSTANGTTTEIATSGNALLVAGGAIGADGQRIETSGVNTLAAESVGAQWLRQTSGDLIVGAVTALKPNDVGGTDKAGLVTTAGNAPINLDVTAGNLTVISNISANGSGSIDLRTGGTNKAIALNGATLSSTSGQVQVLASGDISTSTANGTTTEIATSGNALLVAGGAIGADGRRIETSGVNTLAADRPAPSGCARPAAT